MLSVVYSAGLSLSVEEGSRGAARDLGLNLEHVAGLRVKGAWFGVFNNIRVMCSCTSIDQ